MPLPAARVLISVSPDGNKFVFAAKGIRNENGAIVQQLVICTADGSKEPVTYSEPLLFAESSDFIWLDNGNVMSVRATVADGSKSGSIVYSY